ncbi:hypothetical protein ACFSKM_24850 [Ancylobacter dichloromethanicus]
MTEFAASRAPRRLFRALRLGNDTAGLVKKKMAPAAVNRTIRFVR